MEKKIVVARIQVAKGKENEYFSLVSPLVEATRAEPGNLVYMLYQDFQDPTNFIVYEEYVSEEAFSEHAKSKHFQLFAQQVTLLLAKEIDIQVF